jgi:signal transduction histidine kinase/CheY-like chemotaxis protein
MVGAFRGNGLDVQGLGYIPYVDSSSERATLEAQSAAYYAEIRPDLVYEGFRGIETDVNGTVGVVPRSEQPVYYPVHYLEPLETNEGAIDFDLYSTESRSSTIDAARLTGEHSITERIVIVQAVDDTYSILMISGPTSPDTDLISLVVTIPSLITQSMVVAGAYGVNVYLFDSSFTLSSPEFLGGLTSASGETFVNLPERDLSSLPNALSEDVLTRHQVLNVQNRNWTLVLEKTITTRIVPSNSVLGAAMLVFVGALLATFFLFVQRKSRRSTMREGLAAASAERQLNDFLAHEVRNPLSVALSANQFALTSIHMATWSDPTVFEACSQDLTLVATSLRFIHEILDNLLDLNKFSNGHMDLKEEPMSLLEDVLLPVKTMLSRESTNINIQVDTQGESLPHIADSLRLKQVVMNLAKNSIKFVEVGYVRIAATKIPSDQGGGTRIAVEDSGPGIKPGTEEKLFQQYNESLDKMRQGTGIGLSLCKVIVDSMKGKIYLDKSYHSTIEGRKGARFVVELPVHKQAELELLLSDQTDAPSDLGQEDTIVASTSRTIRFLVVDDDVLVRTILSRRLHKIYPGVAQVESVSSGEHCVDRVTANGPLYYDLIFMDQYMPGPDSPLTGAQTIQILRQQLRVNTSIVGCSANDMAQMHLSAGADTFMRKPLPSNDVLKDVLNGLLHEPPLRRVLVVDDEPMNRMLLMRMLKLIKPSIQCSECNNGEAAIKLIDGGEKFDCVFIDQHMGDGMLGTETAQAIRGNYPEIKLVLVSGASDRHEHYTSFDLVWSKPAPSKKQMATDLCAMMMNNGNITLSMAEEEQRRGIHGGEQKTNP